MLKLQCGKIIVPYSAALRNCKAGVLGAFAGFLASWQEGSYAQYAIIYSF